MRPRARVAGAAGEAVALYDRALTVRPDSFEAHNNRGTALRELNRFEEALASYDRALTLKPDYAGALANRANVHADLRRFDEAFAGYDAALKLEPQLNEVLWNAALAHLVLGDLPAGFAKYESRWQNKLAQQNKRQFPRPLWLGETPLAGKTLLLYAEQGFGDTLQFIRYATLAAAQGARVIVETQPALKRLVAGVPGVSAVFGQGEPLSAYDLRCPLMSLPLAFGTTLDTIPATLPYLAAPVDAVARWRACFDGARARVGLVFSGNPEHKNDRNRSIPLARLAPVVNTPGVRFICLQKDVRPADAATLQQMPQIETVAAELTDFTDTAALIETLDLVVTVDTSVAHLAGALGKPVWLLLPWLPDFRWLLDRADSPWYPSARLFRQPAMGDWDGAIDALAAALAERFPA